MNKLSLIEKYVVCPFCRSDVEIKNQQLVCKGCKKIFSIVDGDIPSMLGDLTADTDFSMTKWDKVYNMNFFQEKSEKEYKELFLDDVLKQVLEYANEDNRKTKTYLEIGCGQGFLGEAIAKRGWLFIGIDFSLNGLRSLKSRLDKYGIKNYLLIHGDIQSLPIRDNSIDLIFGGGVIEHFKNTQIVIDHLFNALTEDGISFNGVPPLNIGNIVYRSSWGGIPNAPILRQLAEFIHLKMLKGRHMVFGYELQFSAAQLKKLHTSAGFKPENVIVDRFYCYAQLHMIKNKRIQAFVRNLCKNNRQFWPAVKVIGIKK